MVLFTLLVNLLAVLVLVSQLSFDGDYKHKRKISKHVENPANVAEGVIYGTKAVGKAYFWESLDLLLSLTGVQSWKAQRVFLRVC